MDASKPRIGHSAKLTDAQKIEARRRAEGATLKELVPGCNVGWIVSRSWKEWQA